VQATHLRILVPTLFAAAAVLLVTGRMVDGGSRMLTWSSVLFALSSLFHAVYTLGTRRSLVFFGLSTTVPFIMEELAIRTCMDGCYTYTEVLGLKLGHVPIIIALGWFSTGYVAYTLVNLIAEGRNWSAHRGAVWICCLALTSAFVQTAWDLSGDPFMVHVEGAWIWSKGGAFFGVPFANYIGWVELGFVVLVVYRFIERDIARKPFGPIVWWFAAIPVAQYAVTGLTEVYFGQPVETRILPIFAQGFTVIAAGLACWRLRRSSEA
jgi:putative membrane protein